MKTKAELMKELEKNYYSVQKKEYQVYDQDEKLTIEFDKLAKSGQTAQKAALKKSVQDDKATKAKFKANNTENKKSFDVKKTDLEVLKKESKKLLTDSLAENKETKLSSVTEVKKNIELAKKESEDLLASVLTQYESEVEELDKRVTILKEKLKKDNHSFEQKIADLSAKHEQAIETIQENEESKIGKFREVNDNEVAKINASIEDEREKTNRKLENLKAVYDDELTEIDESIADAIEDFNAKYTNIKSSNEQRIAVRQKHHQRALDDKDKRSAKAHSKDIVKIQKEMDRDLQLLKKHHEADSITKKDYRYTFIKENLEKWAEIERGFITSQAQKTLEVNVLNAGYDSRVKLAKYDFEKQHVDALESYHKLFAETKEKQLSFELETTVNLENEDLEKNTLDLRFKESSDINKEDLKERLETLNKQLKDIDFNKETKDFEAKIALEKTVAQVELESAVAKFDLDQNQIQNLEDEKIETHQTEYSRHEAYAKELTDFESNVKNLFVVRQTEMVEYEILEVTNRYDQKVKYLSKQIKELEKDYAKMLAKAEEINKLDTVFYQKNIDLQAGDMQEALEIFITEEATRIEEKEAELRTLKPRRNKKLYRALDEEIRVMKETFENNKLEKQAVIDSKVEAYKKALDNSNDRLTSAKTEMEAFFTKELTMLEDALSAEEALKDQSVQALNDRLEMSTGNMEDYQTKVQNRALVNKQHNEEYLNSQVLKHTSEKEVIKNEFEEKLSTFNDQHQETVGVIADKENTTSTDINNRREEVNNALNEFKQESQNAVTAIKTAASNQLESLKATNSGNIDALNAKFTSSNKVFKDELVDQLDQHKDHLAVIEKAVNEESSQLDQETKKLTKESDDKVKDEISLVNNKLKEDITNIK